MKQMPKKTATDKRMDAVLRKLLVTPPQPHVPAVSKTAAKKKRAKS